jgi:hypothetical protein
MPFQDIDQPGAAPCQSRPDRRGALDLAAAEADRRCRARRPAQCRQVDLPRQGHRRQAEDRRLSLHHAASGLGVVRVDAREFVLADIPGLIEGAHEGPWPRRPLPRPCRALPRAAASVDGTSEHAGKAYKTVRQELSLYGEGLDEKPEIVALSKVDALSPELLKEQVARLKRACKRMPIILSSASGEGVEAALRALFAMSTRRARTRRARMPRPRRPAGGRDGSHQRVRAGSMRKTGSHFFASCPRAG